MKEMNMKEYPICAVIWEDHVSKEGNLPNDPDDLVESPTISFGVILKETEKTVLLASTIEPFELNDQVTFLVILKSAILASKEYGKIELRDLRN
jgi:hypothetical protein